MTPDFYKHILKLIFQQLCSLVLHFYISVFNSIVVEHSAAHTSSRNPGWGLREVGGAHVYNRAGDADSVDREADSVSWCCPESGSRILGLFVLPVTWCHCDRCCTRCVPYGQLGSDREKGLFYKTQIVTRSQIKYCCLSKKNEFKIRAISILVKKGASFTENRESFFLDRALPTTAFSSVFSPSAQFSKVKGWLLSVLKSRSSECKNYF